MRRFIISLLAFILVLEPPLQLLAALPAAESIEPIQPVQPIKPPVDPCAQLHPAPAFALPQHAVPGSTAERRAAWETLTQAQQQAMAGQFRTQVIPRVEAALQAQAQARSLDKKSLAPVAPFGSGLLRAVPSERVEADVTACPPAAPVASDLRLNLKSEPALGSEGIAIAVPCELTITATPGSGPPPLTIQFHASADCPLTQYDWEFGDGGRSSDPSPSHTYTEPNVYGVNLFARSKSVFLDAYTEVTVTGNRRPRVHVTASPASGPTPLTVAFTATANDPDGQVVSYTWDFGDGQTGSGAAASHDYVQAGTFTARVTVVDNEGASASASTTITATVPVVDLDQDGLPDGFENELAEAFRPIHHVSTGEQSGTGFAFFGDYVPQTVIETFPPVPPILHLRVKPLGFVTGSSGQQYGVLQLDYLTLWNRDDGLQIGLDCAIALTFLVNAFGPVVALLLDGANGHELDNERSAALVAAPTSNSQYNTSVSAYYAYDYWTAAHEGGLNDKSAYHEPPAPIPAGLHIVLGHSRSKHATYTFNPNGLPLVPPQIMAAFYGAVDELNYSGLIDYDTYLTYLFLLDVVFFSCIVEHFGDQGGSFADTRINVGDVGHPINGSGFIEDSTVGKLQQKLNKDLWILLQ